MAIKTNKTRVDNSGKHLCRNQMEQAAVWRCSRTLKGAYNWRRHEACGYRYSAFGFVVAAPFKVRLLRSREACGYRYSAFGFVVAAPFKVRLENIVVLSW